MIIPVDPISPGGGSSAPVAVEYNYEPGNGETLMIPESSALVINVLLWLADPADQIQLILPSLLAGRRVFIYANESIAQLDVTSIEDGAMVANGVASMSPNDLIVFNTVSTTRKIWARVATS